MGEADQTSPGARRQPAGADRPPSSNGGGPAQPAVPEIGGPKGPEPTRYGDWEQGGRCTDF
jgi:hypothetical protein